MDGRRKVLGLMVPYEFTHSDLCRKKMLNEISYDYHRTQNDNGTWGINPEIKPFMIAEIVKSLDTNNDGMMQKDEIKATRCPATSQGGHTGKLSVPGSCNRCSLQSSPIKRNRFRDSNVSAKEGLMMMHCSHDKCGCAKE